MVKTKSSLVKIVASVIAIIIAFSMLMFIKPSKKSVAAAPELITITAGLYTAGGYTDGGIEDSGNLVKSWDDLIADGDVVVDSYNSYCKVVNKNLEGDLAVLAQVKSFESAFEGCSKLTKIIVENDDNGNGKATNLSRMFYGCSSAQDIRLIGLGFELSPSVQNSNMFAGCKSLQSVTFPIVDDLTFKDLGLLFSSYTSSTGTYTQDDIIPSGYTTVTFGDYIAPTPSVPSTGVVSNTVAIMLVTISVVALSYVGKKKKVVADN